MVWKLLFHGCLFVLCPLAVSPFPGIPPGLHITIPSLCGIFPGSQGLPGPGPLSPPQVQLDAPACTSPTHSPSASTFRCVPNKAPVPSGSYLAVFSSLPTSAYKILRWSSPMRDMEKYHFSCPTDQPDLENMFFIL